MSDDNEEESKHVWIAAIGRDLAAVPDVGDAAGVADEIIAVMCDALEDREFGNTYARAAITSALGAFRLARGQLQMAELFAAREQARHM